MPGKISDKDINLAKKFLGKFAHTVIDDLEEAKEGSKTRSNKKGGSHRSAKRVEPSSIIVHIITGVIFMSILGASYAAITVVLHNPEIASALGVVVPCSNDMQSFLDSWGFVAKSCATRQAEWNAAVANVKAAITAAGASLGYKTVSDWVHTQLTTTTCEIGQKPSSRSRSRSKSRSRSRTRSRDRRSPQYDPRDTASKSKRARGGRKTRKHR
jgi:hypothetical protein